MIRQRPVDDKAFLPSRMIELQDSQSRKSLAQIYEDEYTATSSGEKRVDDRDGKLAAEHEEIEKSWNDISYRLDALCKPTDKTHLLARNNVSANLQYSCLDQVLQILSYVFRYNGSGLR